MQLGREDFESSVHTTGFGDVSIRLVHYRTGLWVEDKINGRSLEEVRRDLRLELEKKLDAYVRGEQNG